MNKEIYREMCNQIYEGESWDRMINCLERKDKEIERLNNMLENDSAKNLELIELINKIRDVAEDNNITGIEARLKILGILEN